MSLNSENINFIFSVMWYLVVLGLVGTLLLTLLGGVGFFDLFKKKKINDN